MSSTHYVPLGPFDHLKVAENLAVGRLTFTTDSSDIAPEEHEVDPLEAHRAATLLREHGELRIRDAIDGEVYIYGLNAGLATVTARSIDDHASAVERYVELYGRRP